MVSRGAHPGQIRGARGTRTPGQRFLPDWHPGRGARAGGASLVLHSASRVNFLGTHVDFVDTYADFHGTHADFVDTCVDFGPFDCLFRPFRQPRKAFERIRGPSRVNKMPPEGQKCFERDFGVIRIWTDWSFTCPENLRKAFFWSREASSDTFEASGTPFEPPKSTFEGSGRVREGS